MRLVIIRAFFRDAVERGLAIKAPKDPQNMNDMPDVAACLASALLGGSRPPVSSGEKGFSHRGLGGLCRSDGRLFVTWDVQDTMAI